MNSAPSPQAGTTVRRGGALQADRPRESPSASDLLEVTGHLGNLNGDGSVHVVGRSTRTKAASDRTFELHGDGIRLRAEHYEIVASRDDRPLGEGARS